MERPLRLGLAAAAVAAFLAAAYLGYVSPSPQVVEEARRLTVLAQLPPGYRFIVIAANNALVAAEELLGGLLILPAYIILAVNGYVAGSFTYYASQRYPLHTLITAMLPHGVPEIAAYIYIVAEAAASSLELLLRRVTPREAAHRLLRAYAATLYLLILAAALEAYVSPRLLGG